MLTKLHVRLPLGSVIRTTYLWALVVGRLPYRIREIEAVYTYNQVVGTFVRCEQALEQSMRYLLNYHVEKFRKGKES